VPVASMPRHRLESLAAALSCYDYRLEIGRVSSVLGLSVQHARLQLRRLRVLDEELGFPSWAITDSRWLGLRAMVVILGRRWGPSRQLSAVFEPGGTPWWRRIHWLPLRHYLAMAAELYGGAYMLVYRVPARYQAEIFDYFNDNADQLGLKAIFGAEQVPVRNCANFVADSVEGITKAYLLHSKVFERELAGGGPPKGLGNRQRLLDVVLYTVLEARPLARYRDLDRLDVAAIARGFPPAPAARLKTRLVQRHYAALSASGHLGRAWLGPLLYRGSDPSLVAVSVPRDCAEILYAAVASTLASPYVLVGSDTAFTVAYAPSGIQREISRFIAAHCGGEADTDVLTRHVAAPMPAEMYSPEERSWSRKPANLVETLRRYGLLQQVARAKS